MKKKVELKMWLDFKPYENITKTDQYYLRMCNEVQETIYEFFHQNNFKSALNDVQLNCLTCVLVSYFEDLTSGTNLWNTFIRLHKKLYHKALPFYDLTDYYEEEINPQDISFLIWYYSNTVQDSKLIKPKDTFISTLTPKIFEIFDRNWETAPENSDLKHYYAFDSNEKDYYKVRRFMEKIFYDSYLFKTDISYELQELIDERLSNKEFPIKKEYLYYEAQIFFLDKAISALLALNCKEWTAEYVGLQSKHLAKDILSISPRVTGDFFYINQDNDYVTFQHIATDKIFKISKNSFNDTNRFNEITKNNIFTFSILQWQKNWHLSGILYDNENNAKNINKIKNNPKNTESFNFLDNKSNTVEEILQLQVETFNEFTNGHKIAFMSRSELRDFIDKYIRFYNDFLYSKKQNSGMNDSILTDIKNKNDDDTIEDLPKNEFQEALVFINPRTGLEIVYDCNSAFPLAYNPYYNPENFLKCVGIIFLEAGISKELVNFCYESCEPQLRNKIQNHFQFNFEKDFDFLMRFLKKNHYSPKPSITLIKV